MFVGWFEHEFCQFKQSVGKMLPMKQFSLIFLTIWPLIHF
jgi:hypothetical protein